MTSFHRTSFRFSDKDLQMMKEDMARWRPGMLLPVYMYGLVARLDAAEAIASNIEDCYCGWQGPKEFIECELHVTWRKAAGKLSEEINDD